jgi:hypothetical protein
MEAHLARIALRLVLLCGVISSLGASARTQNFLVSAPTPELANSIARAAEQYRRDLAILWLGRELPPWRGPCPIQANVSPQLGAGGVTSFIFRGGEACDWQMTVQGSAQRVLDSVLPHEITHTVFATHFGQPLPRWADEGACTTVEHAEEQGRHQQMLITFLQTGRGIAMTKLFAMREYPPDMLPLYAQGYSVARYLIEQGGRRKFVQFVGDGLRDDNWQRAMKKHYGDDSLMALQTRWLDWVRQGSPRLAPQPSSPESTPVRLASTQQRPRPEPNLIYRVSREQLAQSELRSGDVKTNSVSPAKYEASGPPPLVPIRRSQPAGDAMAMATVSQGGWRAAGQPPAAVAETVPPAPLAQPYQAVRQPPPQPTVPLIIEP